MDWPAEHIGPTSLDFVLFGFVKNTVYKTKPLGLAELGE